MVTVRLGDKKMALEVAVKSVDGVMRVQELLQRITASFGMPLGAKAALRCKARWLKADETLAEAGVASGDVVDVWLGEGGGMPGAQSIFASPDALLAGGDDEELAETLGALLGQFSGDFSEIAVAVQRLRTLQEEPQAMASATAEVCV
jgi:hypothetical protein